MNARRTILAATDGTKRSRAVLGRAALVARIWNARLVLVHVRKPLRARFRLSLARISEDDLRATLDQHGGRPEDLFLLEGAPSEQIASLAAQLGAGLVVLGLHRERRVLDSLRMTTMERITLGVSCPVLIAQAHPAQPYRRVLGALSFDPVCSGGLGEAATLAPDAAFHAIHALPITATDTAASRETALNKATAQRSAFLECRGLPPSLQTPEIVPGGVHEVLRYRMAELQPDLLTIGSQSGRDPTRLGNYARDLMRAPPTDVLVTKPDCAPDAVESPIPTTGS